MSARWLLTVNTGSSSVKTARFDVADELRLEARGTADRIGLPDSHLRMTDAAGRWLFEQEAEIADQGAALRALLPRMVGPDQAGEVAAVGHRVVHGGRAYAEPSVITDDVLAALRRLAPIDPEHLPQAIAAIEATQETFPGVPQVACFDTAFHHRMPRVAQIYALPRHLEEAGVIRYGFHGLSYESIVGQLLAMGDATAGGRLVVAHLGSGASMAAVDNGRGVETTMGFTPTGGLMMATRSGDLDPGVLLYLLQVQGMEPAAVNALVNRQAGLLGVSGIGADMRDLLAREAENPRAAEAIALFCYQAKKFVGALAAVLGGLDTLVFTGGIGEHAAAVRARICAGLEFLGVHVNSTRNGKAAAIISPDGTPVTVRVMRTDEDLVIAGQTVRLLQQRGEVHVSV